MRRAHAAGRRGWCSWLLVSALQTDASINPGNSGGALVDCAGKLVGVPTAGATVPSPSGESGGGSIGLGFAIPVDLAKSIADEVIATGRVTHAFFGVQTTPIPPAAAAQAGVPEGLFVQAVSAGGPAAAAGLRPEDVITSIDGEPATTRHASERGRRVGSGEWPGQCGGTSPLSLARGNS
jgi:putative serine protease PepD